MITSSLRNFANWLYGCLRGRWNSLRIKITNSTAGPDPAPLYFQEAKMVVNWKVSIVINHRVWFALKTIDGLSKERKAVLRESLTQNSYLRIICANILVCLERILPQRQPTFTPIQKIYGVHYQETIGFRLGLLSWLNDLQENKHPRPAKCITRVLLKYLAKIPQHQIKWKMA